MYVAASYRWLPMSLFKDKVDSYQNQLYMIERQWEELCITRIVPDLCDGNSELAFTRQRQVPIVTKSLINVTAWPNIYLRSTA